MEMFLIDLASIRTDSTNMVMILKDTIEKDLIKKATIKKVTLKQALIKMDSIDMASIGIRVENSVFKISIKMVMTLMGSIKKATIERGMIDMAEIKTDTIRRVMTKKDLTKKAFIETELSMHIMVLTKKAMIRTDTITLDTINKAMIKEELKS